MNAGTVIAGKYRIERKLGWGGMGTVWAATHLRLDAPVAVKLLAPSLASSTETLARFEREARAAAQLRGAHVVQIFDYGVDDDVPYLVMELLQGEDLAARLKREGRLPIAHVAAIVTQIAAALRRAHAAGIVHRDLKPGNVFLAADQGGEVVKILDFGIAKDLRVDQGDMTKTEDVVGSPLYMSPEQVRGAKHVDHRTDVWALGAIAFKALTGTAPFSGESSGEILVSVATAEPLLASALDPGLPAGVDALFRRAFEKDPERRFQSAGEIAEAFAALMGRGGDPRPSTAPAGEHTATNASLTMRGQAPKPVRARRSPRRAAAAGLFLGAAAAMVWGARTSAWWKAHQGDASLPVAQGTAPMPAASASSPRMPAEDTAAVWNIPLGSSRFAGPATAPVTIVEFGEYQCPLSRRAEAVMARIRRTYGDRVRLVWKDFQAVPHAHAEPAARLVREALAQGGRDLAWSAHQKLFERPALDDAALLAVAKDLQLDETAARAALRERRHQDGIDADTALGDAFEVDVTPTFFVNGRRLAGLQSFERFQPVIEDELRKAEALLAKGVGEDRVYAELLKDGRSEAPPERRTTLGPPESSPRRGSKGAPILVQEFGDFDDPVTRWMEPALAEILARHPRTISLVWRDRPLASRPSSSLGATAGRQALAMRGMDAFWTMHDHLLGGEPPGGLSPALLDRFAAQLQLSPQGFRAGLTDPEHARNIEADRAAAAAAGVTRTPAFVISRGVACGASDRVEGYFLEGPVPARKLKRLIDRALAE